MRLLALAIVLGLTACASSAERSDDGAAEATLGADEARCTAPNRFVVDASRDVVIEGELTWQRTILSEQVTLDEAMASCEAREGWRVPTSAELTTLLVAPGLLRGPSPAACVPAIDQRAFPETPADWFWTSDARAKVVDFADGRVHGTLAEERAYVRCVKTATR